MNQATSKRIPKAILDRISACWELRFGQKIEACRILLSEISHELGLLPREIALDDVSSENFFACSEILLLDASLARADGDLERCLGQTHRVQEAFRSRAIAASFSLSFQRGLNAFMASDYSFALECFLAAKAAASGSSQGSLHRSRALMNCLICLEYLGLPHSTTREQLENELQRSSFPPAMLQQLSAFDFRQAFRAGELEQVLRFPPGQDSASQLSQARYYQLWISELPFAPDSGRDPKREIEFFVSECQRLHQHSYRVRTLLGLIHPTDLQEFRRSELADRLYLWVWRWICSPESAPFSSIAALLGLLSRQISSTQIGAEDFQMIRNATLWIGLFSAGDETTIHAAASRFKPSRVPSFPIFELEELMLRYFFMRRDGDRHGAETLLGQLRSHPTYPKLAWRGLIEALAFVGAGADFPVSEKLRPLQLSLQALFEQVRVEDSKKLLIDTVTGELVSGSQRQISPPLCAAFELLRDRRVVSVDELLLRTFGIRRYEPVIHDTKVFNLLSRMRKVAPPGIGVGVKSGSVRAEGDEGAWARIVLRTRHPMMAEVASSEEWRAFLYKRQATGGATTSGAEYFVRPAVLLKKLKGARELTRAELEKLTGKSRATANRVIARWLKDGTLEKIGSARNTRYLLKERGSKPL